MRVLCYLSAVLVLGPTAARAANWFELDTLRTPGGLVVEVDTDSLRQANGRRTAQVRVTYPEARRHPSGGIYRSVVTAVEFECEGRIAGYRDASFHSAQRGQGPVTARDVGQHPISDATRELLPPRNLQLLIRASCSRPSSAVP